MSQNVYKKVDYTLSGLIEKIKLGEIALPDLQRPFIWKNSQVRNLFDSLYLGYPVGFFLFWETDGNASAKAIGTSEKQRNAQLLVVDGQQRLTSLYAVVTGAEVIRENFSKETIEIAFDPINEKFEVANITTLKSRNFIPNITRLWENDIDIYEDIAQPYLDALRETREVTSDEAKTIRKRLHRVQNIKNTLFIALELSAEIKVEKVAEVFVRINAEGKKLKEADFILTLMSVFWEDGRKDLEEFSRQTKTPSTDRSTAYNHYFSPDPDMLLRAGIGLGFRRARLQYVYALLTGRDLETQKKDETRRDAQFDLLKEAQAHALDLQNWHDYLKCIRDAGFRNSRMLSSEMSMIYNYVHYLIGRVSFNIDKQTLAKAMTQWFFMTMLTSRYASSPESKMESDLARFRELKTGEEFLNVLAAICDEQMTDDYWTINLPTALANSSASNRAMMGYFASLSILKAKALYSERFVADLLDPSVRAPRSALERHHLFPKDYLKKKGFKQYQYNQTANYALMEYATNADISNKSPQSYVPNYEQKFLKQELVEMYKLHALPDGWEDMDYESFLQKRRELMAAVTRDGYLKLRPYGRVEPSPQHIIAQDIQEGEGEHIEFKSTLRKNLHTNQNDPKMELSVLKTIAGFLNSDGGTLYVGIADDGEAIGLEPDGFPNEDKLMLHLTNLINSRIGKTQNLYIHMQCEDYQDKRALTIDCTPSRSATWVKDGNSQRFFVRTGPSTSELNGSDAQYYIEQRF